jgi:hypothetical protein
MSKLTLAQFIPEFINLSVWAAIKKSKEKLTLLFVRLTAMSAKVSGVNAIVLPKAIKTTASVIRLCG